MGAIGLRVIPVDTDRVLFKRGLRELVVGGSGLGALTEQLVTLLDGSRTTDEIVATFPSDDHDAVADLLRALADRNLVSARPDLDRHWAGSDPQLLFYREFTSSPDEVRERLRSARVLVVGWNRIAASLVRSLADLGIGATTALGHGGLDSGESPTMHQAAGGVTGNGSTSLRVIAGPFGEEFERESWSAIVATSDFGDAEALLDVNREALRSGRPFLPVWITNMVGHVGPLTYPFETACLRCYRLRANANDPNHEITRSIRDHLGRCDPADRPVSALPPMVDVVAGIAAMEVVKLLGGFVPSDVVGRAIEINLVSFRSAVRRVLKVPRCPDCSEAMDTASVALTRGPRLPQH